MYLIKLFMKQVKLIAALLLFALGASAQTVTPDPGPYTPMNQKYEYRWIKNSGGIWNLGKFVQVDSAQFNGIVYVPSAASNDSSIKAANTGWVRRLFATGGGGGGTTGKWDTAGNAGLTDPRLGTTDNTPYAFVTNNIKRLIMPAAGILSASSNYVYLVKDTINGELKYTTSAGGGGDTTGLGNLYIRNTTSQENKRFNVKGGRLDTLYASTSGGGRIVSNSGTITAEWGAGGGANFDFHGFAGYNENRASSYTARSFTDKNYVDSTVAAGGGGGTTPQYKNIIITGQSNAWGASGPTSYDTAAHPRVLIWQHAQASPAWVTARINQRPFRTAGYNAVDGTATRDDLNGSANSAFYLAKKLADENPFDTIRIIMAIGDGRNSSFWFNGATRGQYTDSIINRAVASGIQHTDLLIVSQGESDGALAEATFNSRWDSVKNTLRRQAWFKPTTPIVFSGMPQTSYGASPSNVADKDTTLQKYDYNTDDWDGYGNTVLGLTISTDNVHFSAGSLDTLGRQRYYAAWKALPQRYLERNKSLVAAAVASSAWGTSGNSGTVAGTNYLGTSDNVLNLEFRVNASVKAGLVKYQSATAGQTYFGYSAGQNNTAVSTTAIGNLALTANTTGLDNTAVGNRALATNSTGAYNVAVGFEAGQGNNSTNNILIGYQAGRTSGNSNVAIGFQSMNSATGASNVAIGLNSLSGAHAQGTNVAIGRDVLTAALTAGGNTSVGYQSGLSTTGGGNVFLGNLAGAFNVAGSNQIILNSLNRATYTRDQNESPYYAQQNSTSMLNQISTVNGRLGINTIAPSAWLQLSRGTPVAATAPLKFVAPISLATTAATGNGSLVTLTFASTTNPPFVLGSQIIVSGVTPAGYNGTYNVTAVTATTVSYASATTGSQTVAGTITQGSLLTTPEAGAVEFDGTNYFVTSSTTRFTLAKTLVNTATLDFGSTAAGAATDLTMTVTGAADGDAVSIGVPNGSTVANGSFTAWVSATNTVTIRFSNSNLVTALDPASGTFRAVVLKY